MASVNKIIRELRRHLGDSQQSFANRLGLSIRSVANYEKARRPDVQSLVRLEVAARSAGREDLAAKFAKAVDDRVAETGVYSERDGSLLVLIGKELALNSVSNTLIAQIEDMINQAHQGNYVFHSPESLNGSDRRREYIEGLVLAFKRTADKRHKQLIGSLRESQSISSPETPTKSARTSPSDIPIEGKSRYFDLEEEE
jgi:transcriptional regulator with XRE-family HTH domain